MVLQHFTSNATDAHHTKEMVVAHHVGVKLIGDPDVVPVGGRIAVFHQTLDFVGT